MEVVCKQVDRVPGDNQRESRVRQLITFYNDPPKEELSLDEFERFAFDRLQLLRKIDNFQTRGFTGNDLIDKISLAEKMFFEGSSDPKLQDIASHYILRLAYCRSEDLRRWFTQQEQVLFKKRLERLDQKERQSFIHENGLSFETATVEARNDRKDFLLDLADVNIQNFHSTTFFKIPFEQAVSLIKGRSVYLEQGFAWVPINNLIDIIVVKFRANLSRSLTEATRMFDRIAIDSRIAPILKNMHKQYIGKDFSKTENLDVLTPEKVDQAADNNMPLCAKFMHKHLKQEHKLKHWARMQYGLFLKGAGMNLEDALVFWEGHFSKVMTHDQFVKGYSYTFRHMYGKEGSRKDYTAPSCHKIIMGTPPESGAYHGCPYKHLPDNQLVGLLSGLKIGSTEVKEIVSIAKAGHYQIACLKHFDVTHPGHQSINMHSEGLAEHPNQWFRASVEYNKVKSSLVPSQTTSTPSQSTLKEINLKYEKSVDLNIPPTPKQEDSMKDEEDIMDVDQNNDSFKKSREWDEQENVNIPNT